MLRGGVLMGGWRELCEVWSRIIIILASTEISQCSQKAPPCWKHLLTDIIIGVFFRALKFREIDSSSNNVTQYIVRASPLGSRHGRMVNLPLLSSDCRGPLLWSKKVRPSRILDKKWIKDHPRCDHQVYWPHDLVLLVQDQSSVNVKFSRHQELDGGRPW